MSRSGTTTRKSSMAGRRAGLMHGLSKDHGR
jgi:hypothetical protein